MAFYELTTAGPDVEIEIPLGYKKISLIITCYDAYHPGFQQHYDAAVALLGDGKQDVVRIIWATYANQLTFSGLNPTTRVEKMNYQGYGVTAVDKVAMSMFGRNAGTIITRYHGGSLISIPKPLGNFKLMSSRFLVSQ